MTTLEMKNAEGKFFIGEEEVSKEIYEYVTNLKSQIDASKDVMTMLNKKMKVSNSVEMYMKTKLNELVETYYN